MKYPWMKAPVCNHCHEEAEILSRPRGLCLCCLRRLARLRRR